MNINIIIALLVLHFLGDFPLQNDWMANNKSNSILPLVFHCLVYAALFLPFGICFFAITFLIHFVLDFITSRVNKKLYSLDKHLFFVNLGLDQMIHQATLMLTYYFLYV